jgi:hypothetical protein
MSGQAIIGYLPMPRASLLQQLALRSAEAHRDAVTKPHHMSDMLSNTTQNDNKHAGCQWLLHCAVHASKPKVCNTACHVAYVTQVMSSICKTWP